MNKVWRRALVPGLIVLALAIGLAGPPKTTANAAPRTAVSAIEKDTLLANHNEWRARYKMPPLIWDDALANVADGWANLLAGGTVDGHRPDNQFGENIWSGTSGAFPITSVTDDWGGEVGGYDLVNNVCLTGQVCGHFTQVVWYNTVRIGCGKATGNGTDYVVCNYDPPGNFDGQSPFGP